MQNKKFILGIVRPNELVLNTIASLNYKNENGYKAIKKLYGDLSSFAHSKAFQRVNHFKEDCSSFPAHDQSELEESTHDGKFYHTLLYIFRTMEIIISLLLISSFEEISFHSVYRTHTFLNSFYDYMRGV
jgi:hypothetical protein